MLLNFLSSVFRFTLAFHLLQISKIKSISKKTLKYVASPWEGKFKFHVSFCELSLIQHCIFSKVGSLCGKIPYTQNGNLGSLAWWRSYGVSCSQSPKTPWNWVTLIVTQESWCILREVVEPLKIHDKSDWQMSFNEGQQRDYPSLESGLALRWLTHCLQNQTLRTSLCAGVRLTTVIKFISYFIKL